jgi:hypothetical protein
LNQFLDFHELRHGSYAIKDDLDALIFNTVASTIPKIADIQTSEMNAKLTPVNFGLSRVQSGNNGKQTILV